eukprot:TRINITY_DN3776_c0_g1_i1.p1 TRINITY_DN3776_c0_g1~~TRINITY_DN3776_c0_g1_i1.p1  ORF type:complete len:439 (+),score=56.24 TRINITY_DN3776_c0_g1_i1:176-1318(+)
MRKTWRVESVQSQAIVSPSQQMRGDEFVMNLRANDLMFDLLQHRIRKQTWICDWMDLGFTQKETFFEWNRFCLNDGMQEDLSSVPFAVLLKLLLSGIQLLEGAHYMVAGQTSERYESSFNKILTYFLHFTEDSVDMYPPAVLDQIAMSIHMWNHHLATKSFVQMFEPFPSGMIFQSNMWQEKIWSPAAEAATIISQMWNPFLKDVHLHPHLEGMINICYKIPLDGNCTAAINLFVGAFCALAVTNRLSDSVLQYLDHCKDVIDARLEYENVCVLTNIYAYYGAKAYLCLCLGDHVNAISFAKECFRSCHNFENQKVITKPELFGYSSALRVLLRLGSNEDIQKGWRCVKTMNLNFEILSKILSTDSNAPVSYTHLTLPTT